MCASLFSALIFLGFSVGPGFLDHLCLLNSHLFGLSDTLMFFLFLSSSLPFLKFSLLREPVFRGWLYSVCWSLFVSLHQNVQPAWTQSRGLLFPSRAHNLTCWLSVFFLGVTSITTCLKPNLPPVSLDYFLSRLVSSSHAAVLLLVSHSWNYVISASSLFIQVCETLYHNFPLCLHLYSPTATILSQASISGFLTELSVSGHSPFQSTLWRLWQVSLQYIVSFKRVCDFYQPSFISLKFVFFFGFSSWHPWLLYLTQPCLLLIPYRTLTLQQHWSLYYSLNTWWVHMPTAATC